MDIQVLDEGFGWFVVVDGVVRTGSMGLFEACLEARRWGW